MAIIDDLRLTPGATCTANAFRTGPAAGSFEGVQEGGLCEISCEKVDTGIYDLKATAGRGTDYFYPWLQRNYTWVRVPKNVANGTIVMTAGMNGCTLIVSEQGNDYYFYHDGDSRYLPSGSGNIVGNEIVRVTPAIYDPNDLVSNLFKNRLAGLMKVDKSKVVGDVSYGSFNIAVKTNGQFEIYGSGLICVGKPMGLSLGLLASFV